MAKRPNKLERQCEELDIPLDEIILRRGAADIENKFTGKKKSVNAWFFDNIPYATPEQAAIAYYQSLGYFAIGGEGRFPTLLMKCACYEELRSLNESAGRTLGILHYFDAECSLNKSHLGILVDAIRKSSENEVLSRYLAARSSRSYFSCKYPEIDYHSVKAIWNSIGGEGWSRIAENFMKHITCSGWPDLTIANGNQLRFIEVKTTDNLDSWQEHVISSILLASGMSVSVLRLVAQK